MFTWRFDITMTYIKKKTWFELKIFSLKRKLFQFAYFTMNINQSNLFVFHILNDISSQNNLQTKVVLFFQLYKNNDLEHYLDNVELHININIYKWIWLLNICTLKFELFDFDTGDEQMLHCSWNFGHQSIETERREEKGNI